MAETFDALPVAEVAPVHADDAEAAVAAAPEVVRRVAASRGVVGADDFALVAVELDVADGDDRNAEPVKLVRDGVGAVEFGDDERPDAVFDHEAADMVEIHALDRERHQLDRAVFGGQPFDDGGDQRRIVAAVQAVAVGSASGRRCIR